jgi:hypothetical protein
MDKNRRGMRLMKRKGIKREEFDTYGIKLENYLEEELGVNVNAQQLVELMMFTLQQLEIEKEW